MNILMLILTVKLSVHEVEATVQRTSVHRALHLLAARRPLAPPVVQRLHQTPSQAKHVKYIAGNPNE